MASLYTDERLLAVLRTLADELGHVPTCRELLARRNLPGPATYIRRFEGWNNALKAAGLKARYPRHAPIYTDKELIKALRNLANELDRAPTKQEMLARDLPTPVTLINRFGSWNAALAAAGLETRPRVTRTDKELLDALRKLAAELGRTPLSKEMLVQRGLPSPGAYQKHFGSWNAALEAAGLEPNQWRRSSAQAARET